VYAVAGVAIMSSKALVIRVSLFVIALLMALTVAEIGLRFRAWRADPGVEDPERALARSESASPAQAPAATSLRGMVRPSRNPDLVYELKPKLDVVFRGVRVRTNSLGMRDRDFVRLAPPDTLRVAGVGDSVMFGWGVEELQSYLQVAERLLDEVSEPRVEVLNFAVPGYNAAMEVELVRDRVLAFSPDVLILHFVPNDFDLPPFLLQPVDVWALDRLWLLELLREGRRGLAGSRPEWLEAAAVEELPDRERRRVHERYRHLSGEPAFRRAMAELASLTEARPIPVLFVVLQCESGPSREACGVASGHGFRVVELGPALTSYIAEHEIRPTPEGFSETFWLSAEDPHPNPLAHALHAEVVAEAVLRVLSEGQRDVPKS
jgi:hypothetical protein